MKMLENYILIFIFLTFDANAQCNHLISLTVQQPSSYINTPNFPQKYPPGSSCQFQVVAPKNYLVHINCNYNIDKSNTNCDSEWMYISADGDRTDPVYEYLCGSGSIQRVTTSNEAILGYKSSSIYSNYAGVFSCLVTAKPCECGWSRSSKISGGTEAGTNEFPFMVGLIENNEVFCGGSIISSRYIVTAAHCMKGRNRQNFKALVGEHDLSKPNESPYTKPYEIESIKMHENYLPNLGDLNDIALLRTSKFIEFSLGVGPVCLPLLYAYYDFDSVKADVLGWGTMGLAAPRSKVLLKARTEVRPNNFCEHQFPTINKDQMCTYNPPKDSCQYDSGGPLVYTYGRMFLIGIISYGGACGSNTAAVNTRVTSYLKWIEENTHHESFCRKALEQT